MSKGDLKKSDEVILVSDKLIDDLTVLIESTQKNLDRTVNSTLSMLYWNIGRRINEDILQNERAEYGKEVLSHLAKVLTQKFGKGFNRSALSRMSLFHKAFPIQEICATLSHKLSWSHFVEIIKRKEPLEREFYAEMCRLEKWSVRTLRERIDSMLYERTALSKKPEELISQELSDLRQNDSVSPNLIFKDPYVLDFLGLNDHYYEKDLEDAILRELEKFLLELGAGFTFIARQHRLQIGRDDFYVDLLLYNRKLKRLVAIDLKLGDFKAAYKGQMELYLRYLAKYEQEADELPPLGLILCAGKDEEQIELLELGEGDVRVADYLTLLPSKEVLKEKLQEAIQTSRQRLANKEINE